MEDSPSGLWRTLGKRVGVTASRVRISYPPPGFEPRKPLESFGFRGFALVPSDCRFPPGSLRFDTFGPDLPRVSHIGTDDSENAFEPPRVRHRSPTPPHASRRRADPNPLMPPAQFFRFGSQQSPTPAAQRDAPHAVRPSAKAPRTPSDKRHTNAYGCHNSPFEPSINSFIHRQEAKERSSAGRVRGETGKPYRQHPPPGIRQRTAPAPP